MAKLTPPPDSAEATIVELVNEAQRIDRELRLITKGAVYLQPTADDDRPLRHGRPGPPAYRAISWDDAQDFALQAARK